MKKFRDLEYRRPDMRKAAEDYLACINRFKEAKTFEEANAAFMERTRVMRGLQTMMTVAHIRNTVNMADEFYDAEIKFINEETPRLMPIEKLDSEALIQSPFRKQLEELYGEQFFKDAETRQSLINDEIIEPSIAENTLSTEENAALLALGNKLASAKGVPCTACHYCVSHCPQELDIPNLLVDMEQILTKLKDMQINQCLQWELLQ